MDEDGDPRGRNEGYRKVFGGSHQMFAEGIRSGNCGDLASGYDGLRATEAALVALKSTNRNSG